MWKNIVQPDESLDNMAPAHYTLGTYGYKQIIRICNNYCFSTSTTTARTRLNVT